MNGKGGVKFFADSMLGKLSRWMRTLGYDVEYEKEIDDPELVKRAAAEGRIILTRDTLLIKRRKARGRYFFIKSDSIKNQLKEVTGEFRIEPGLFLTRCLRCNVILEDIKPEEAKDRVPPYVYSTQKKFSICPECRRVYWAGTHRERMVEDIDKLLEEED